MAQKEYLIVTNGVSQFFDSPQKIESPPAVISFKNRNVPFFESETENRFFMKHIDNQASKNHMKHH